MDDTFEPQIQEFKKGQFIPDAVKPLPPPGFNANFPMCKVKPMPFQPAVMKWPVLEKAYEFDCTKVQKVEFDNKVPMQLFSNGNHRVHPNLRSYFDRDRSWVKNGMPKTELEMSVSWLHSTPSLAPPTHAGLAWILENDRKKEEKRKKEWKQNTTTTTLKESEETRGAG